MLAVKFYALRLLPLARATAAKAMKSPVHRGMLLLSPVAGTEELAGGRAPWAAMSYLSPVYVPVSTGV